MSKRKCPVCGSDKKKIIKHIHNIVPEGQILPYGEDSDLCACTECGFVYHDVEDMGLAEQYYNIYTGNGSEAAYRITEDTRMLNEGCARFAANAGITSDSEILDIGCSYGVLLSILNEMGFGNTYGMDEDKAAIAYLKKKGFKAETGNVLSDGFREFENKFDLIILRFLVEHLYDPGVAIRNVERWLKPEGKLMIVVPDISLYVESEPFPGYYVEFEHINHFSINSLTNLMNEWTLTAFEKTPVFYPTLRSIFRKSKEGTREIVNDMNDLKYMMRHFTECNVSANALMDKIGLLEKRQTEVALWGAGNFVNRLLTHTNLSHCNIKYIVDRNPGLQGKELSGNVILSPEEFVGKDFRGSIIISGRASRDNIVESIRGLGLENDVICLSD